MLSPSMKTLSRKEWGLENDGIGRRGQKVKEKGLKHLEYPLELSILFKDITSSKELKGETGE